MEIEGLRNMGYLIGIPIIALGVVVLIIGYFKTRLPKCTYCNKRKPITYFSLGPGDLWQTLCDDCAKAQKLDVRSMFASEEAYQAFLKGRRHA